MRHTRQGSTPELIDTLWNVNEDVDSAVDEAARRINRYIMECKFNSG